MNKMDRLTDAERELGDRRYSRDDAGNEVAVCYWFREDVVVSILAARTAALTAERDEAVAEWKSCSKDFIGANDDRNKYRMMHAQAAADLAAANARADQLRQECDDRVMEALRDHAAESLARQTALRERIAELEAERDQRDKVHEKWCEYRARIDKALALANEWENLGKRWSLDDEGRTFEGLAEELRAALAGDAGPAQERSPEANQHHADTSHDVRWNQDCEMWACLDCSWVDSAFIPIGDAGPDGEEQA